MKFQPQVLRIMTLPIGSLLFVIAVAAVHPVCATELKAESDAERYVLEEVQKGLDADLERKFPPNSFLKEERELRGSFIEQLLTNRDPHLKIPHGISIDHALITGALNLIGEEIPYDVSMNDCTFDQYVEFQDSRFAKSLNLSGAKFNWGVTLYGATIGFDFIAQDCSVSKPGADFDGIRVGGDFRIDRSTFSSVRTSFERARVGGMFSADFSEFNSKYVGFDDMRVDGIFSARGCAFRFDEDARTKSFMTNDSKVSFIGAHFADVVLNKSTFEKVSTIDFTRMQADFISFDEVKFKTPSEINLERMTFKLLSPVNTEKLGFLLSHYDAEFYANLEASLRTHGYPDEADNIFIAKKRAERRENCKDFLRQCNRGSWAWSYFEDMLAGYGKSLQNLLYWSLGFLMIGIFVFRSEKGMRIKDPRDVPHYEGRYQAFWYSLDLFLPIIKLGEADVWTPNDNRRWANLYRKLHIIIGSLFVPIGLAAWTGIIK